MTVKRWEDIKMKKFSAEDLRRIDREVQGELRSAVSFERQGKEVPMTKLMLEVPTEVIDAVRLPPGELERELLKELALALYNRGVLSLGKARLLAQMTRWQFEELLGERQIPRHYTEADLEEDLRYAQGCL
jgi:predicted HTH domain antitoxin